MMACFNYSFEYNFVSKICCDILQFVLFGLNIFYPNIVSHFIFTTTKYKIVLLDTNRLYQNKIFSLKTDI